MVADLLLEFRGGGLVGLVRIYEGMFSPLLSCSCARSIELPVPRHYGREALGQPTPALGFVIGHFRQLLPFLDLCHGVRKKVLVREWLLMHVWQPFHDAATVFTLSRVQFGGAFPYLCGNLVVL